MCLRSANAESTERLFSQVKHISLKATNRKPDKVLTTVLLSMQAKQTTCYTNQPHKDSMVSQLAKKVPHYKETVISKAFLECRYKAGKHIYKESAHIWNMVKGYGGKQKRMGTNSLIQMVILLSIHVCPQLMHFRDATIEDVYTSSEEK